MLPAGTTLEFNWLKVLSPFGMQDVNIFLRYSNSIPYPPPNFKSVALTSSSINSEQTNKQKQTNLCDIFN